MDKCLDCGFPFRKCRCEELEEREVMDVYTFITQACGFAVIAMAG